MKTIPKKKRIKVYKRALEIVENEECIYNNEGKKGSEIGLCLLFRCIDSNLNSYMDDYDKFGNNWDHAHTPNLYPEFKKYFLDDFNMRFERIFFNNRDLWRRVVLRLILEELKANEEH